MEQAVRNKMVIEVSKFHTWMGDDGIARTCVKNNADIELADAQENTRAVQQLYEGKKFPLLVDVRPVKSISKEARDHFSIRNRETVITCFALIIQSPLSCIIGNFFMGLNKPSVPMRLFTSEKNALVWLKKFL